MKGCGDFNGFADFKQPCLQGAPCKWAVGNKLFIVTKNQGLLALIE